MLEFLFLAYESTDAVADIDFELGEPLDSGKTFFSDLEVTNKSYFCSILQLQF